MALWISHRVLPLPIWLVSGFVFNLRPGRLNPGEMVVNVGDVHDHPCAGHISRFRRTELVLLSDAVKPNIGPTETDLSMHWFALGRPLHTSRLESEYVNQEVMSSLDILVYEQRDNALR